MVKVHIHQCAHFVQEQRWPFRLDGGLRFLQRWYLVSLFHIKANRIVTHLSIPALTLATGSSLNPQTICQYDRFCCLAHQVVHYQR